MNAEHPPPWRTHENRHGGVEIIDSDGNPVVTVDDPYQRLEFESDRARELILAAPEMEALLRALPDILHDGSVARLNFAARQVDELLARIDAAARA